MLTVLLLILATGAVAYVFIGSGDGESDSAGEQQAAADCDPAGCMPGCKGDKMAAPVAPAMPEDGVVVYYFHGHQRCQTCNRMESLAAAAISEGFADQQKRGTVVFRPVNIETDATRHFVADFELSNRSVVMVTRQDGKDLGWRRLDEVWQKIGDDTTYKGYISENLAACLQEIEAGPS